MSKSSALRQEELDTPICGNTECSNPIEEGGDRWVWKPHGNGKEIWFCDMKCAMDYAKSAKPEKLEIVKESFTTETRVHTLTLQPSTGSIELRPSLT